MRRATWSPGPHDDAGHPVEVLDGQRLVQPELLAEHLAVRLGHLRVVERTHGDGVARRRSDEEEAQDADAQ